MAIQQAAAVASSPLSTFDAKGHTAKKDEWMEEKGNAESETCGNWQSCSGLSDR